MPRGAGPDAAPAPRRPAFIVFLLIWLAILTGGVVFVGRALLSGPDEGAGVMILWLAVAGGAWCVGVWLLARALRPRRRRSQP
ncbi:hypothetical protein [Pikeienuella sp. HZG-20]|uniref:hypothetical protein n=1 Tax=Paludibacillus litoralis TaxID=3133267 RepID=UPI0030EC10C7